MSELSFSFTAELWEWSSRTSWFFLTLPLEAADDLIEFVPARKGFGSVPVKVTIGSSHWRTSVFPHKESGSFVLPVKKAIRVKEGIVPGDTADVALVVALDL